MDGTTKPGMSPDELTLREALVNGQFTNVITSLSAIISMINRRNGTTWNVVGVLGDFNTPDIVDYVCALSQDSPSGKSDTAAIFISTNKAEVILLETCKADDMYDRLHALMNDEPRMRQLARHSMVRASLPGVND